MDRREFLQGLGLVLAGAAAGPALLEAAERFLPSEYRAVGTLGAWVLVPDLGVYRFEPIEIMQITELKEDRRGQYLLVRRGVAGSWTQPRRMDLFGELEPGFSRQRILNQKMGVRYLT